MNNVVKGSFELMKQLNIKAILNVIRKYGALSRADLAKMTGLTPASVTNITKALIDEGLLIEKGMGESSGGRPPIILELNMNSRYIIGVNIGAGIIDVVLTNLNSDILTRRVEVIDKENVKFDIVFNKLVKLINEVLGENTKIEDKLLGIGVAMHGIVNSKTGISEYAPYYHWENINIKEKLQEYFKYTVYVDNDVRAMALAESWFGIAKSISNFITINVSNGIGAGIIIDNKLYYGVDFSAGEIGHIVVEPDGGLCNCGNYGCLETISSNDSIVRLVKKKIKQGSKSILSERKFDLEVLNIEDVCEAAKDGDELSISVIKEAIKYIGIAISNLVNILNPMEIVVVGKIFEDSTHAIEELEDIVLRRSLKINQRVKVVNSLLGSNSAVIGATTLIVQEFFYENEF